MKKDAGNRKISLQRNPMGARSFTRTYTEKYGGYGEYEERA